MSTAKRKLQNSKKPVNQQNKKQKLSDDLADALKGSCFENCNQDLILNSDKFVADEIQSLKNLSGSAAVKKKYTEIQQDVKRIVTSQFKVELFGLRASGLGAPDGRLEIFVGSGE